jgi:hypothetical protein
VNHGFVEAVGKDTVFADAESSIRSPVFERVQECSGRWILERWGATVMKLQVP